MKFLEKCIQDQWHFVIGKGVADQDAFYAELERELAENIKALNLKTGYKNVGNLFSSKKMHFVKFGNYMSLTCAEPFGVDLNISWYLYFTKGDATAMGTGFALIISDIIGQFTGKTKDKVIAFAAMGRDSAERATKKILAAREEKEKQTSGDLGETIRV